MTEKTPTISSGEIDYLDEDKQIRGQNYCLLSFISPEDVLKDKEIYYFGRFLEQFGKDMKTLFDGIQAKYPDSKDLVDTLKQNHSYVYDSDELQEQYKFFKSTKSSDIESDFHRENNFKTSMRGIKIRGTFDTIEEAKNRSEFLKRIDNKFDIYIAQVGCWCPWSPNPNDLQDQEFAETQLNTLMKQYKTNMNSKDELFEQRKNDVVKNAKKPLDAGEMSDSLQDVDPWTAKKLAEKSSEDAPTSTEATPTEATPTEATPTEATPTEDVASEDKNEVI
jgi:hypothetical protein